MTTIIEHIAAAIAADPRKKFTAKELCDAVNVSHSELQVYTKRLCERGVIQRAKVPGLKFFRFFMSEEQFIRYKSGAVVLNRRKYRDRLPLQSDKVALSPDADTFCLVTETHDIPTRICFLKHLKENTVFGSHATLDLLISDYQRTLKLRNAIALRVEDE